MIIQDVTLVTLDPCMLADRVKGTQAAISQAFGTALVGLIYVAFLLVFAIAVAVMNQNAYPI